MFTPLKKTSGNVVISVIIVSLLALTFFTFLTNATMRSLVQIRNLENSAVAYFTIESQAEKTIVEYFSSSGIPPTIDDESDICVESLSLGESIADIRSCGGADNIGKLKRQATRYAGSLKGFLGRYSATEYWFTDKEKETGRNFDDLNQIRITWNTGDIGHGTSINESAPLEIILAHWPKTAPKNIQTARVYLTPDSSSNIYVYNLTDFRIPQGADDGKNFKPDTYNYILFLKTKGLPTHYKIEGINSSGSVIWLPGKTLVVSLKATIEDERDPENTISRYLKTSKQIYTDFDSTFPYAKHQIN